MMSWSRRIFIRCLETSKIIIGETGLEINLPGPPIFATLEPMVTDPRDWNLVALIAVTAALGVLAPVVHLKLGTIFLLSAAWAGATRWLARRAAPTTANPARELLTSIRAGLLISVLVFGALSILNIAARTISPGWRWFQLP
jgi:hypothetical protein